MERQYRPIKIIGAGSGACRMVHAMPENMRERFAFAACDRSQPVFSDSPGRETVMIPPCAERLETELSAFLGTDTCLLLIMACLGGTTGSEFAPQIAQIARNKGIPVFGLLALPSGSEGSGCRHRAVSVFGKICEHADSVMLSDHETLKKRSASLTAAEAFGETARSFSDALRNLCYPFLHERLIDFDPMDLKWSLNGGNFFTTCTGYGQGTAKVRNALDKAVRSLLSPAAENPVNARHVLAILSTKIWDGISPDTLSDIPDRLQRQFGPDTEINWTFVSDDTLPQDTSKTILIASGTTKHSK